MTTMPLVNTRMSSTTMLPSAPKQKAGPAPGRGDLEAHCNDLQLDVQYLALQGINKNGPYTIYQLFWCQTHYIGYLRGPGSIVLQLSCPGCGNGGSCSAGTTLHIPPASFDGHVWSSSVLPCLKTVKHPNPRSESGEGLGRLPSEDA